MRTFGKIGIALALAMAVGAISEVAGASPLIRGDHFAATVAGTDDTVLIYHKPGHKMKAKHWDRGRHYGWSQGKHKGWNKHKGRNHHS